jgi:hypothetical protein
MKISDLLEGGMSLAEAGWHHGKMNHVSAVLR